MKVFEYEQREVGSHPGLLGQIANASTKGLRHVGTVEKQIPCVTEEVKEQNEDFDNGMEWRRGHNGHWEKVARDSDNQGVDGQDATYASPGPRSMSDLMAVTRAQMHGLVATDGSREWAAPRLATYCAQTARSGYASGLAHEFLDEPTVLAEKLDMLAGMVKKSCAMIAYTGAGISTSSGISDYATQSSAGVIGRTAKKSGAALSPLEARPTKAHHALATLARAGHLKKWIQQNHDGLPQKAGTPQEVMNEIHGAWQDPSNPVVPMSGSLRGDLFKDMLEWEQKTDLCLSMGTSMCGMNADRCAVTVGERACRHERGVQGLVIVNLQQTQHDGICTLRIFAPIDKVMEGLASRMDLQAPAETAHYSPPSVSRETLESGVFENVPYNEQGTRSATAKTTLDLREGATLTVTAGMYAGDVAEVTGRARNGSFKLTLRHQIKQNFTASVPVVLGLWWVEAAVKGTVPLLPMVNCAAASS